MKFKCVSGRRCLDFAGTLKYRDSAREEQLTNPQQLSDWAVQARAGGCRDRNHRWRTGGRDRAARSHHRIVFARPQLLARLAANLLDLLAGPDIEKVKECSDAGCTRLDASRARNRVVHPSAL